MSDEYADIMLNAMKDINAKHQAKHNKQVDVSTLTEALNTALQEFGEGDIDDKGHPKDNA